MNILTKFFQRVLGDFHKKIKQVIRILTNIGRMNPVFQQNYNQILLDITFTQARIATSAYHGRPEDDNTIQYLLKFAKENIQNPYCFPTLKRYFELLNHEEVASFVGALGSENTKDTEVSRCILLTHGQTHLTLLGPRSV